MPLVNLKYHIQLHIIDYAPLLETIGQKLQSHLEMWMTILKKA